MVKLSQVNYLWLNTEFNKIAKGLGKPYIISEIYLPCNEFTGDKFITMNLPKIQKCYVYNLLLTQLWLLIFFFYILVLYLNKCGN